jgi:RHS repeat-associated protein
MNMTNFYRVEVRAVVSSVNTGITLTVGQRLTVFTSGTVFLDGPSNVPWNDADGITIAPYAPNGRLEGKIGNGSWFVIGKNYDQVVTTSGLLYLRVLDSNYGDNKGFFYANVVLDAPGEPIHNAPCPFGNDMSASPASVNPIELRDGNKILTITDLSVMTPVGPLSFTRSYNQSQRNHPRYQYMGMGWSHNHHYKLVITGTLAEIFLPNGGVLKLNDAGSIGVFVASAGSTSQLQWVSPNYVLTLQDKSLLTFEPSGIANEYRLKTYRWPNNDIWTYNYSATPGNLTEVNDGYGRKLQLRYIASGSFDNGQLWRVGDHTVPDLGATNPTGSFVEFGYISEKNNGIVVPGTPKALLASVWDVRDDRSGQRVEWKYDYYGQHIGESNADQLNFMTQRLSPNIDVTGDSNHDGTITLEQLTYNTTGSTITSIQQLRGNGVLQTDFAFQPSGKNITTETVAGKKTTHQFANGVYLGTANPATDSTLQVFDDNYRPQNQVDGNGNTSALTWSADGKHLDKVTDALGHETAFVYQADDVLHSALDAEGRTTLYLYEDEANPRQPTRILVTKPRELAVNGGMELTTDWASFNSPTTNIRSSDQVDSGVYSRFVATNAADKGIQGNTWDLIANRTYIITARVYALSGAVRMQVTGTTAFNKSSTVNGTWETLKVVYKPSAHSTGRRLQFVSSGGAAEFYVDTVSIQVTGDLAVNGDMELDSDWTAVGSVFANDHYLDPSSGSYVRHVSASTNSGIQSPTFNLTANRLYIITAQVSRVGLFAGGAVKMTVTGTTAFDQTTNVNGWKTLTAVYKPTTNLSNVRLSFLGSGTSSFYVDNVHILDATFIERWQEFGYDAKGRTLVEKLIDPADGVTAQQQITRTYYTSGDGNGLLQQITQEDIGGANDVNTIYTYDSAGRVIQTQQNTNFGNCSISRTVYDKAGNVLATLCNFKPGTTNPIYPSTVTQARTLRQRLYNFSDPDHYTDSETNRLTIYEYDALGRRVKTIANAEDGIHEIVSLTVYDALDRVTRTITNYRPVSGVSNPYTVARAAFDAHHGAANTENLVTDTEYNTRGLVKKQVDVLGNVTLYGYNDAGRLIKTIQSANQPNYNNNYSGTSPDPTLGSYVLNSSADKDIITTYTYDPAGNQIQMIDPLGNVHYTSYDALNRPIRTLRSAKDSATLALNFGEAGYNAQNDPRNPPPYYVTSVNPDRDLVEETEYDGMGRVIRTKRLLENRPSLVWDYTLFGYDKLGRQVKVIRSASKPTYDLVADPDLSDYPALVDADKDIITQTFYDAKGRVQYTLDPLNVQTRFAYDGLGRQFKTILNSTYVSGSPAPEADTYKGDLTDPAEDIISQTYFDTSGRVQRTKSVLRTNSGGTDLEWRWTLYGYDDIGRQVKVIQNASQPDYFTTNPTDSDLSSYVPVTDTDKDIITHTEYDAQGRVWKTFDTRNNETRHEYDVLGRRVKTTVNYVDGTFSSSVPDEDLVSTTVYDIAGRVIKMVNPAGVETRYVYDTLGRRIRTVTNYVAQGSSQPANWLWDATDGRWEDGSNNIIDLGTLKDQNLISQTVYNKGGQVVSIRDAYGTLTTFTYDKAGRRISTTRASGTALATTDYTCFDKAGRVLRVIQNWDGTGSPDAKSGTAWVFTPTTHGEDEDDNLITAYTYDAIGRQLSITDPMGNVTSMTYFKDGHVESVTDPTLVVTQHRYDKLRRRTRVVQGHVANAEDPALWRWDNGQNRWENSTGTVVIAHGTDNDQNIIVDVAYDKAGRMLSLRDPNGKLTTFAYDLLDRRTSKTNPINKVWATSYLENVNGTTVTQLLDPNGVLTKRNYDRLGRPTVIDYSNPSDTPTVVFTYDASGNRAQMREFGGGSTTNPIRTTAYQYDDMHRLTQVSFTRDSNADGTPDAASEIVSYQYDVRGLRTQLTMPRSLSVTYVYNAKGELTSLSDWGSQQTTFTYDKAGRHATTQRANGVKSTYKYDAGSRLKWLRHTTPTKTLAHFEYQFDGRGNRTQALEALANEATTSDTLIPFNDVGLVLVGNWSNVSGFKETTVQTATLKFMFLGSMATLTLGKGPGHGIAEIYLDNVLYQTFDGYAASAAQEDVPISIPNDEGPHLLEIRNTSANKVRFKQLLVADKTYDLYTIEYSYDKLSRVQEARYVPNIKVGAVDADLLYRYQYNYDRAGNRTQEITKIGAATAVTENFTYNAANQITNTGYAYDNNGNLIDDGTVTYNWDRANRPSLGGYDGEGNLISAVQTRYLPDVQPGLHTILVDDFYGISGGAGGPVYNVYGPRGLHTAINPNSSTTRTYPLDDGLGTVRVVTNNNTDVLSNRLYSPYGELVNDTWNSLTHHEVRHGFAGEWTVRNGGGGQYLRARHYSPRLGAFLSLDPLEGTPDRPMSLNGYSYVEGNPTNWTDPSGLQCAFGETCFIQPNVDMTLCEAYPDLCSGGNLISNISTQIEEGDFVQTDLVQLAGWCNSGSCVDFETNCPSHVPFCAFTLTNSIIVGTPVSGLTNRELSKLCKEGNGEFNEACQELLRRCNAKETPAVGDLDPCGRTRSTCTDERMDEIQALKDFACSQSYGCNAKTECPDIVDNLLAAHACYTIRKMEIDECFQQHGDDGHEQAVKDAKDAIAICTALFFTREMLFIKLRVDKTPCPDWKLFPL